MVSLGVSGDGFTGLGFSEPPPPEPQAEINSADNAEIKKCLFDFRYNLSFLQVLSVISLLHQ